MAGARSLHAAFHQLRKIDVFAMYTARASLSCFQDLFHRAHQAVRIIEHESIKTSALRVVHLRLTAFESLQVKADRGDGGFQLVRNGIDETIMLLIAPNFANQETGIQNEPSDDCAKEQNAEKDFDVLLPVQDDPAKTDGDGSSCQRNTKGKKEGNLPAAAYAHEMILARECTPGMYTKTGV